MNAYARSESMVAKPFGSPIRKGNHQVLPTSTALQRESDKVSTQLTRIACLLSVVFPGHLGTRAGFRPLSPRGSKRISCEPLVTKRLKSCRLFCRFGWASAPGSGRSQRAGPTVNGWPRTRGGDPLSLIRGLVLVGGSVYVGKWLPSQKVRDLTDCPRKLSRDDR